MDLYGDGHKIVTDADHIPGRNYLSGTAPVSVQGQNIVRQAITTYALTDKSLSNQVVTFNMTITSDTTSGRLYIGSSPNWQVYTYYDVQKGINKVKFTTELNSDVDGIKITIDNSTANLIIQDVTLNKGNFAREYSPAPEDYVAKSDFDKKINIDNQIGSNPNISLPTSDNWSDIFGVNTGTSWTDRHNLLRVGQTQATDYFYGKNSSALFFGSGDTKGGLEVHYADHEARIVGGNNPKILWSERIAWQSDIQRLEQEIADLKKQIGGSKAQ